MLRQLQAHFHSNAIFYMSIRTAVVMISLLIAALIAEVYLK